jgi:hypothetical protein
VDAFFLGWTNSARQHQRPPALPFFAGRAQTRTDATDTAEPWRPSQSWPSVVPDSNRAWILPDGRATSGIVIPMYAPFYAPFLGSTRSLTAPVAFSPRWSRRRSVAAVLVEVEVIRP